MLNDSGSSDEGSAAGGPALPAGVLKSSTAWGDDLELNHARERIRQGRDAGSNNQHTAVDINQFRNVEVGVGFQARHVVRQKTGNNEAGGGVKIRDMGASGDASATKERRSKSGRDAKEEERRKDKRKQTEVVDKASKRSRKDKDTNNKQTMADRYLECKGVRDFRLELEKILSSA